MSQEDPTAVPTPPAASHHGCGAWRQSLDFTELLLTVAGQWRTPDARRLADRLIDLSVQMAALLARAWDAPERGQSPDADLAAADLLALESEAVLLTFRRLRQLPEALSLAGFQLIGAIREEIEAQRPSELAVAPSTPPIVDQPEPTPPAPPAASPTPPEVASTSPECTPPPPTEPAPAQTVTPTPVLDAPRPVAPNGAPKPGSTAPVSPPPPAGRPNGRTEAKVAQMEPAAPPRQQAAAPAIPPAAPPPPRPAPGFQRVIVDGSNFLGSAEGYALRDPESRRQFMLRVGDRCRVESSQRWTVFFDGSKASRLVRGNLEERTTGNGRPADDVILEYLNQLPEPDRRRATVITDDRALAAAIRAAGAKVQPVQWLASRLAPPAERPLPVPTPPPAANAPSSLAEWESFFQAPPKRPGKQ